MFIAAAGGGSGLRWPVTPAGAGKLCGPFDRQALAWVGV
jgi:hypothetical protein